MTNYEKIKSMSEEDFGYLLCKLCDFTSCRDCFAFERCTGQCDGFVNWLKLDVKDCRCDIVWR